MGGFSPEGNKIQTGLVLGCSAVIMGRRTYESFAAGWPAMPGSPLADKTNAMPKYVASTTLSAPAWNNTHLITGDLVEFARRLREEAEDDLARHLDVPLRKRNVLPLLALSPEPAACVNGAGIQPSTGLTGSWRRSPGCAGWLPPGPGHDGPAVRARAMASATPPVHGSPWPGSSIPALIPSRLAKDASARGVSAFSPDGMICGPVRPV
jgi:hypothetical protein